MNSFDSSENSLDPQALAALIDGRLTGPEREALLARLAASDDDAALFSDAVAVSAELLGDEQRAAAPSARPTRTALRGQTWLALALAAGIVAVAATALLTREDGARTFAQLLARPAAYPAGMDASPWSDARSTGIVLSERSRSTRLGALATELELRVAAADPSAGQPADAIVEHLAGVPGSGPVAALFRQLRAPTGSADAASVGHAVDRLRAIVDAEWFTVGAWLQAARVAASRSDAAFFASDESRRAQALLARRLQDDATLSAAASQLAEQLGAANPDWAAVQAQLTLLLADII
jgi:hypothetical protein